MKKIKGLIFKNLYAFRPKVSDDRTDEVLPIIAPPPTTAQNAFNDTSPRFNPFDQSESALSAFPDDAILPFGEYC